MTWLGHYLTGARVVIFMRWLAGIKIVAAPSVCGNTIVITVVKTLRSFALCGVSASDWIGWRFVKL